MAVQYQGYIENGKVIFDKASIIPPERKRITVIFHDVKDISQHSVTRKTDSSSAQSRSQRQLEALDEFLAEIRSTNDESITDEDMAWLANNRVTFRKELEL